MIQIIKVRIKTSFHAELEGDVSAAVDRTAVEFALSDYTSWLLELNAAYSVSWQERVAVLEPMEYTAQSVSSAVDVWERPVLGVQGISIHYTNSAAEWSPLTGNINYFTCRYHG